MENTSPPPPANVPVPGPPSTPGASGWEREIRTQGYLIRVLMVVVTLVLVTTTLSLFHQIRWLVAQANQLNVTIQELARGVGDYETNVAPQLNRLYQDLQRLAQANTEYARLFAKYQVTNLAAGRTNPAPVAGSPAP